MPKTINIIDEMPLTAVGKLFKPALVCTEIAQIIKLALTESLPAKSYQISVQPDKKLGINATIEIAPTSDAKAIKEVITTQLADYAFNYQVVGADQSLVESV